MVVLGFIGEGPTEKAILESSTFRQYLDANSINFIPDVIDIEGGGNLLPERREESVEVLKDKGATHILILADKESAPCITSVKQRIAPGSSQFLTVSVKAIEAWFLADSSTLSKLFRKKYEYELPEQTVGMPFDILRKEFVNHTGRGFGSSKPRLAHKLILEGFTIQNAAAHPNCPSARYFLDKLKAIAAGQA